MVPARLDGWLERFHANNPDGPQRVVSQERFDHDPLAVLLVRRGGYAVGVLIGRTPMAPTISPKKSWEGFAGSVLFCAVVGAVSLPALLDGPWWAGALLGAMAASTATVGDLIESSIKRDLGIKDMSHLLPGHGGLMDRLDSLIVTVAPVWAVLLWIVPPASAS
mgnify:CR=1 FL=1